MKLRLGRTVRVALFASVLAASSLASIVFAQASSLPTLSLKVSGSSITASGAMQSGGVNVVTTSSAKKGGSTVLFLLKPGVTEAEVVAFLKSKQAKDPNASGKYGSIVFSVESVPGKTVEAQTTLVPGEYLALASPGNGPPKFLTRFTVKAASSPVSLPKPQATVRSIEFDFRGPTTLRDGELVRFVNEGYLVHMDLAFPVSSRSNANKVANALLTGHEKGLKKLISGAPVGFSGPVAHGAYQQETITAKPGWYVQVCFMETQEGVPHTRLGMERVIKITK
jgi:hypothetical protein